MRASKAVCRNPECAWRDEPRRIDWPKAGPAMILQGTLVCFCEWHMELLPDPVPETPYGMSAADWEAYAVKWMDPPTRRRRFLGINNRYRQR